MRKLTILHLYPSELGINGDVGNVKALHRRSAWRGVTAEVVNHEVGAAPPAEVDLVHIGSGPASAQRAVHEDVVRIAAALREWREAGVPFLAIAGGWQLLGRELELQDGTVLPGAAVYPSRARLTSARAVGEITGKDADGLPLAGFENHSSVTTLLDDAVPLMTVVRGFGNSGAGNAAGPRIEGVRVGSSIGTNLHGPFLPLNPRVADELLSAALARHGETLPEADSRVIAIDKTASNARAAIVARVGR